MKKAFFYKKLKDNTVKCSLCQWECVIKEGARGICRTRENIKGELYSLVYGNPTGFQVDPIEKKPFYHFNPGSWVYSFGTLGCNFKCEYCCNWIFSQETPEKEDIKVTPKEVVTSAIAARCQGIAYTYNEPTIFLEYAYDIMKLAKKQGLFNVMVTNGSITKSALEKVHAFLDAVVIDFKGFNKEFNEKYVHAPLEFTKNGVKYYSKYKHIHKEVTNLVVPNLNDNLDDIRALVKFVKKWLGKDTPMHFIRFFPMYKMKNIAQTPKKTLLACYEIAKEEGMEYVYIGNIDTDKNHTYCPKCNELLIQRRGLLFSKSYLKDKSCPKCGYKINIVGKIHDEAARTPHYIA